MPAVDRADAYDEATDGCRRMVRGMRDDVPHEHRVKPDEETHALAELDYEKEPIYRWAADAAYSS